MKLLTRPGDGAGDSERSVTEWIADLKHGENDAAARLFGRYSDKVAKLALENLRNAPCTAAGEEENVCPNVTENAVPCGLLDHPFRFWFLGVQFGQCFLFHLKGIRSLFLLCNALWR